MAVVQAKQRVDLLFRAFADRTRLSPSSTCCRMARCAWATWSISSACLSRTSRHLAYLRRAKLVVVRKAGLWCFYSLTIPQSEFHDKLLECLECCFADVPEIKADQARARKLRKSGKGCCPTSEHVSRVTKNGHTKACCVKPSRTKANCR